MTRFPANAGAATQECVAAFKSWVETYVTEESIARNGMALGIYANRIEEFCDEFIDAAETDGIDVDADYLDEILGVMAEIDAARAAKAEAQPQPATEERPS